MSHWLHACFQKTILHWSCRASRSAGYIGHIHTFASPCDTGYMEDLVTVAVYMPLKDALILATYRPLGYSIPLSV